MSDLSENGTASLWRHRRFLRFCVAQGTSEFGDQVTLLALPTAAIVILHASAIDLGIITALSYLPFLLFGLPAGVWVDRWPRQRILIVCDLARGVLIASVPVAYWAGVLTLWQCFIVAFAVGIGTVFAETATHTVVPALVLRDQLLDANGKLEMSTSAALLAGPAAAGWLLTVLKAPFALVVDVVTFFAAALLKVRLGMREVARRQSATARPPVRAEVTVGLRFLVRHPLLRRIVMATAISNLFATFSTSLYVLYGVQDLRLTPAEIGVALTVGSLSLLLAAPLSSRLLRAMGIGPALVASGLLPGLSILVLALADADTALVAFMVWRALFAFGVTIYNVAQYGVRQVSIPAAMLGRVTGAIRFVVWGVIPAGGLLGGVLGDLFGARVALVVAGLGALTAVVPLVGSPVRSLRGLPDSADEEANYESTTIAR